jgi:SAM-dependent methyltransferase
MGTRWRTAAPAATEAGRGHGALSPALLAWLAQEAAATGSVLDVGTGTGRLALTLAPRARRVLGIDRDAAALVDARRRARRAGRDNVVFVVADAEEADYRALCRPDAVVAHLCMSDRIVERAAAGLPAEGVLAFAAFHVDQWRETGRLSHFAYDEGRLRAVLEGAGFRVVRLEVERAVQEFRSADDALAYAARFRPRWDGDGRWRGFEEAVAGGVRTLTESRVVVLARLAGPVAP